jgi:hypothetical protein
VWCDALHPFRLQNYTVDVALFSALLWLPSELVQISEGVAVVVHRPTIR